MAIRPANPASAGFTLIELMISLALFALISLAGITLVETVVGVQDRTAGRIDRLGELQRGLFLIAADFEQVSAGPRLEGTSLGLYRASRTGTVEVAYRFDGGALRRSAGAGEQVILTGVTSLGWRFLKSGIWTDQPITAEDKTRPRAVEMTVVLTESLRGRGGQVRRVFELPAEK